MAAVSRSAMAASSRSAMAAASRSAMAASSRSAMAAASRSAMAVSIGVQIRCERDKMKGGLRERFLRGEVVRERREGWGGFCTRDFRGGE